MLRCRQLKRVASLAECMCPSHLVCAARHSAAGCCSQITVSGRRLTAPAISPASRLGPFSAPAAEPFAAAAANSRAQTPLLLLCQPLAQDIVICKSFTSCSTGSKLQALGSDQSQFSPRQDKEYEAAKNSAAGSLSLRPHSRKELETKLKDKDYSPVAISRALDRLKELELQSDADYAEVYTRSKWRQSRWAPSRIQQELLRKGVGRADCQAALESVFGESLRGRIRVNMDAVEDVDEDTLSIFGTEECIDHQLLGSARRQAEMTVNLPTEARRRRLSGWLLRRGHDWETVSKVLALLHL